MSAHIIETINRYSLLVRRWIYFGLLLCFLADIGFSFKQHYSTPLDGDMVGGIVPANDVKPILANPLGTNVILKNKTYPNPNRFFSHWIFKEYFSSIPFFVQRFADPIDSVYISCAIAKTIIQIIIIILLAIAISGSKDMLKIDFILAAVLVTPLFQTNGYRGYMGIIDPSTTYTFFYALPCALLLLYFLPFIRQFYHSTELSSKLTTGILWIPLAIVVSLSGPLNPGIALICAFLFLLNNVKNNYVQLDQDGIIKRASVAIKLIPKSYWFYLLPISIFSLYSLYIGRFNSIDIANHIPLKELYLKLPLGIYYQFVQKLGFPVLFLILIINTIIISRKFDSVEGKMILSILKWIIIFALIYILLLPFGGYRPYRPHVLRYDTIMPITLSLMYVFGISTLYLIKSMSTRQKIWYLPLIVGVLFIFTNADKAEFDKNQCERIALKEISLSNERVVQIQNDCMVLSWVRIIKPEDSDLNARLLYFWGLTKEKKLYFNK